TASTTPTRSSASSTRSRRRRRRRCRRSTPATSRATARRSSRRSRSRGWSSRRRPTTTRPASCSSPTSTASRTTSAWSRAWRARGTLGTWASSSFSLTRPACCSTPSWRWSACGSCCASPGWRREDGGVSAFLTPAPGLARLSLNTATVRAGLLETVEACARAGVPWIAPWRQQFADVPVRQAANAIRAAGLRVSSLCRGGFFPAEDERERLRRIDDNLRALDEAAALGAEVLVLVCGGVVGRDLVGSRQMVEDGIAALLEPAEARGVRLGIEPLHPMFAADRSVVVTLGQANDIVERLRSPWVGVVVDVYHVWWDPRVEDEVRRAGDSVLGFHVNDWIV